MNIFHGIYLSEDSSCHMKDGKEERGGGVREERILWFGIGITFLKDFMYEGTISGPFFVF